MDLQNKKIGFKQKQYNYLHHMKHLFLFLILLFACPVAFSQSKKELKDSIFHLQENVDSLAVVVTLCEFENGEWTRHYRELKLEADSLAIVNQKMSKENLELKTGYRQLYLEKKILEDSIQKLLSKSVTSKPAAKPIKVTESKPELIIPEGSTHKSNQPFGTDGTNKNPRVRLSDPELEHIEIAVSVAVYLKLTVDENGNVIDVISTSKTTTTDQEVINKVINAVKQVKYSIKLGAEPEVFFLRVNVNAS